VAAKFGLGRGLDALLPIEQGQAWQDEGAAKSDKDGVLSLRLDAILVDPAQPRKHFDEEALAELSDSIREHGVIQPIIVDAVEDDGGPRYRIIAGERRYRAAALAGLHEIPALLRDYSGGERLEVAIIENIQRTDLNPIEEAEAYKRLMDSGGLSQEAAAAKLGKNRSTMANTLRLLKLPLPVRQALVVGTISAGHARALLSLESPEAQARLFAEIQDAGLSVREAEKRAA
jgi:ParB family chromosome partitioning protein